MNYDIIKSKIEDTVCTQHNNHPQMTINGDNVQIATCCKNFRDESFEYLKELILEETHKSIMDAFNGL